MMTMTKLTTTNQKGFEVSVEIAAAATTQTKLRLEMNSQAAVVEVEVEVDTPATRSRPANSTLFQLHSASSSNSSAPSVLRQLWRSERTRRRSSRSAFDTARG